jgi:hypothetical protein
MNKKDNKHIINTASDRRDGGGSNSKQLAERNSKGQK